MNKENLKTDIEIFICNHKRDNRDNCFDRGSSELTDHLKKWAKEKHTGKVRVIRSGCLGKCEKGIAAVCYPNREFVLEIDKSEIQALKDYINHQVV